MILCGGPDWPTSVLAGILGISVFQCELGTCPIIASVVPLCLSGSFYLRRVGYGEVWPRLGNFMFILTGAVSVAFWAGMAWAIQERVRGAPSMGRRSPRHTSVSYSSLKYYYMVLEAAVTFSKNCHEHEVA